MLSPRPVPLPAALVVKKGSNSLPRWSSATPGPVSENDAVTRLTSPEQDVSIRQQTSAPIGRHHRVLSVVHQIQEGRLEPARVPPDRRQVLREVGLNLYPRYAEAVALQPQGPLQDLA